MKIERLASRAIRQGAEMLELYLVRRTDGVADCYRLAWVEPPQRGRKRAMLDCRDFTGQRAASNAMAAFVKAK